MIRNINWELLITIFSLLLSIGSIIYAYFNKKIETDIIGTWYDDSSESLYISFTVVNASHSLVPITDIQLYKNNKLITDNGYEPRVTLMSMHAPDRFSTPFDEKIYIQPNRQETFSYYVNEIPNKIILYSSTRLKTFSKSKSFSVTFKRE